MNTEEMEDLVFLLRQVLDRICDRRYEEFTKNLMRDAGAQGVSIHLAMLIYKLNKKIVEV